MHYFLYSLGNYWKSTENQRNFFIEFASTKGFDPLIPSNWKNVTYRDIIEHGGGSLLSNIYNTVHQALVELFPDIGLCYLLFLLFLTRKILNLGPFEQKNTTSIYLFPAIVLPMN